MKRLALVGLLALGTTVGSAFPALAAPTILPEKENNNAQFVETTFRSLCQRAPDPASFNYYWNLLNDGVKTPSEVRSAISISCLHGARADACQHITGLNGLCQQNPTN